MKVGHADFPIILVIMNSTGIRSPSARFPIEATHRLMLIQIWFPPDVIQNIFAEAPRMAAPPAERRRIVPG